MRDSVSEDKETFPYLPLHHASALCGNRGLAEVLRPHGRNLAVDTIHTQLGQEGSDADHLSRQAIETTCCSARAVANLIVWTTSVRSMPNS